MRTLVKRIAERALIASGVATAARASRRGDLLILAYHNVLPNDEPLAGDTSLHLSLRDFVRQLDALAESHDIVPLADALFNGAPVRGARPRVVITFDDAYVGALTVALPELVRRGIPSTVFVAPGLLGEETWWDRIADPKSGAVRGELRDRLLVALHGEGQTIIRAIAPGAPRFALNPPFRIGTEAQVLDAATLAGVTIGSHSWTHSNLASLDARRLEDELTSSQEWLRTRMSTYIPWLSYPYGLFSPEVEHTAARLGFAGSLMVDGGWLGTAARAPHRIPRFNVPSRISLDGFRLRLSGLGAR